MKLNSVSYTGAKTKEVTVNAFDKVADPSIVAQAVRVYLSNQRQGTAKTKTRSEVDLTKAKWFKQKGTGRARHGAQSAPIFVGGGVTHGPRGNANWKLSMSKTMKKVALRTAFALQAAQGNVLVSEGLENASGKTKEMAAFFAGVLPTKRAILLVTGSANDALTRATRNIENVLVVSSENVTTYFVMRAHKILITPEALEKLEVRLGDGKDDNSAQEVAPVVKKATRTVKKKVSEKASV